MLDEIDKLSSDIMAILLPLFGKCLTQTKLQLSDHYPKSPLTFHASFSLPLQYGHEHPAGIVGQMEIIKVPGYIQEETPEIALQFLIPEQLEENGLHEENNNFTEEALRFIIKSYTYEAGVRNLERQIGAVLRKTARKKAEGEKIIKRITPEVVEQRLGPVEFFPITAELQDEIGMSTAIAWTENGGEIMQIEVLVIPGGKFANHRSSEAKLCKNRRRLP